MYFSKKSDNLLQKENVHEGRLAMKFKSFRNSLMLICFLVAVVTASIIGTVSGISLSSTSKLSIEEYQQAMKDGYNNEIKSEVQSAITVLEYQYSQFQAGKITEEEAKNRASEQIRNMRYGDEGDGYFWIDDLEYTLIMHPILVDDEGKNRFELQDQNGVMIIQKIVKTVQADEAGGFNEFYFTKSDGVTVAPKIAFSAMFKPWGWVVSTGNYVDDMNATMQRVEDEINSQFIRTMWTLAIMVVICAIITIVIAGIYAKKIMKPLTIIRGFADRLADGDLTTAVEVKERNEFGQTAKALNESQVKMKELIGSIITVANKLNETITSCSQSFDDMQHSIHEVSKSIDMISQNVAAQADSTTSAADDVKYITGEVGDANIEVSSLNESMNQLSTQSVNTLDQLVEVNTKIKSDIETMYHQTEVTNESAQNIQSVVEFINAISTQTNLLALNASIEAARAGESGRGFSVVAKEIGSLAEQSTQAVEKIGKSITELIGKSNQSMELMRVMDETVEEQVKTLEHTQQIFKQLYSNIDQCILSIGNIREKTGNMEQHSNNINDSLGILNELAQGNAANAEETTSLTVELESNVVSATDSMKELLDSVHNLTNQINKFRI